MLQHWLPLNYVRHITGETPRSLILLFQDASSLPPRKLPGGYSSSTLLGVFLFVITFNGICLRPGITRPNENRAIQLTYIDDARKAASINLKKSLIPDPKFWPFPLTSNERTQMIVDPSEKRLQFELGRFHQVTQQKH